jgi:hypothetical protein
VCEKNTEDAFEGAATHVLLELYLNTNLNHISIIFLRSWPHCNQRAKCAITCIYIVTCLSLGNKYLFRCSKVTTEAANWAPIWSTPSRKQQQWWRLWSGTHFYSRGKRGGALLRAPVCQICWPCPLCCLHPLRTKVLLQQIWVMTEAQYKTH